MARRHWPPRETAKALNAGKLPEFIGKDAVCALTGWTRALLEVQSRTGAFPKPVLLTRTRAVRWKTELVAKWLKEHGITQPPEPVCWRGPEPYLRRKKTSKVSRRKRGSQTVSP